MTVISSFPYFDIFFIIFFHLIRVEPVAGASGSVNVLFSPRAHLRSFYVLHLGLPLETISIPRWMNAAEGLVRRYRTHIVHALMYVHN
jgi:hypothetical protein